MYMLTRHTVKIVPLRFERLDATELGRDGTPGTWSHAPGSAARVRAAFPLEVPGDALYVDEFVEEVIERSNCGPRMGGSPTVVRLRGRVVTTFLASGLLRSAGTGEELLVKTFDTSTPNGRSTPVLFELPRDIRLLGIVGRETAGDMSIVSMCGGTADAGGARKKGSRPICVGELGAEFIDIVDANEMSRSEDRYASASSQSTAIEGELGWETAA